MEMRNLNIFCKHLMTRCAPIILKADTSLAAGVSCILSLFEDMTPDICQFWDTTALLSPVKVRFKVRKFATK